MGESLNAVAIKDTRAACMHCIGARAPHRAYCSFLASCEGRNTNAMFSSNGSIYLRRQMVMPANYWSQNTVIYFLKLRLAQGSSSNSPLHGPHARLPHSDILTLNRDYSGEWENQKRYLKYEGLPDPLFILLVISQVTWSPLNLSLSNIGIFLDISWPSSSWLFIPFILMWILKSKS